MSILTGHIVAIFLFLHSGSFFCQQLSFNSQYYLTPLIYNPALTGVPDEAKLFITHKEQWASIPGTPFTNTAMFDSPLKKKKVALGMSLHNESRGIMKKN